MRGGGIAPAVSRACRSFRLFHDERGGVFVVGKRQHQRAVRQQLGADGAEVLGAGIGAREGVSFLQLRKQQSFFFPSHTQSNSL